ncbi:MAG: pentapeptide repeat-containing protein, partial [Pseudonocardia sp.]|nr:pentapeptide repeat-containing protein [Pseudonocardia sp.]
MTPRLHRAQVERHVAELHRRASLTAMQAARLVTVTGLVDGEGRFLLRAALVAAEFPAGDAQGQEAFQDFRRRINEAAATAGVPLRLELDSRKAPPDRRHGWFTGGDLVDDGIATFSGEAVRTGIEHPVGPEVAELGRSRRTRVYVSVAPPRTLAEARRLTDLRTRLGDALALDPDRTWELADPDAVGIGEDPEEARDRLCAVADVRVVLAAPPYFAGAERERARALREGGRVVAFALDGLPDHPAVLGGLDRREVRCRDRPWSTLRSPEQRRSYVQDLVDEIHRALRPPAAPGRVPDDHLADWSARLARTRRAGDSAVLIEPDSAETRLSESRLDSAGAEHGPGLPAVDRLVQWATAGAGPRLCALLGDVGMGKTTTAKLFTRRLLELRAAGAGAPLPILFDLRDVRITGLVATLTLDHLLDGMLDANRPAGVPAELLCADVVRQRLSRGDAVVVFDGLDEVLVHLSPHDQQVFTRQLWRAIGADSSARMLLTCRTQYFRTIRDEVTFFTGQDRHGLRGDDYLALLMLPFREEQVREYLAANVDRDAEWVDGFLATIGAVHDLPDLARRPLTLRLIADQVEFIEAAKLAGRTLRSVDLYGEFVDRWLSRDGGKHTLEPEHKQLLMEEIAAALWRSGRNSWGPAEVDDWLLALLDRRPDLRRHYRDPLPDLWKADFRTATFLSREGDEFEFGHRSLFEYFLARHLARVLGDPAADPDAVAMPVPSRETLEFLGQSLAGAPEQDRARAVATLARIGEEYRPDASEVAFAYALHAADRGHPHQSLVGVGLAGARLSGWGIGPDDPDRPLLAMPGADLRGAQLRDAWLGRVDLTGADLGGADLTVAELHDCILDGARVAGAQAIGTVLRACRIRGVDLATTTSYRAEVLGCTPPPRAPGLLVAPREGAGSAKPGPEERLGLFTGHTGPLRAVAWSTDNTRILTAGDDGTARIWDATTAQPLHTLTGHTGWVQAVAWSPDNTRILTAGDDGTARIWDATTAQPLH